VARFLDGQTARIQAVSVVSTGTGIDIVAPGLAEPLQHWPWASVRWADAAGGRLGSSLMPDARLELDPEERAHLEALVPALAPGAQRSAHWKLVGMLAAAGLAIFATVFFGIPAASGPLARMTPASVERQLGDSVEAQLDLALDICPDTTSAGAVALQRLGERIARTADLASPVTVRVLEMDMVNAFALPGSRVWVTRGLIAEADSGDQLAAVVAHEIAHVENRDVMAGLYRAMGFGLILDAVIGGGSGAGQQLIALGSNLTEMRHSRDVETRADRRGIELLKAAGLDSRGMAGFFAKLAALEGQSGEGLSRFAEIIASHPDTSRRVTEARRLEAPGAPALSDPDWQAIRALCPG
jgi:predicted Zn-dependent protease